MVDALKQLEKVANRVYSASLGSTADKSYQIAHPFDARNIHQKIAEASKQLFDDGHYRQATFEAFIRIEERVRNASSINNTGFDLMMRAFNEGDPAIALNLLSNLSERDEQKGYRHMFAGSMSGIRNPRAHSIFYETMDECLDHLSIASALMRKIDNAQS